MKFFIKNRFKKIHESLYISSLTNALSRFILQMKGRVHLMQWRFSVCTLLISTIFLTILWVYVKVRVAYPDRLSRLTCMDVAMFHTCEWRSWHLNRRKKKWRASMVSYNGWYDRMLIVFYLLKKTQYWSIPCSRIKIFSI